MNRLLEAGHRLNPAAQPGGSAAMRNSATAVRPPCCSRAAVLFRQVGCVIPMR
jgi:hypothetical protein